MPITRDEGRLHENTEARSNEKDKKPRNRKGGVIMGGGAQRATL